jgi:hypothetical protein
LKQFPGYVTTKVEALTFFTAALLADNSKVTDLTEQTRIVVAKPKEILAKWRWFIVGGKVISGSMYRFKGAIHQEEELDACVIAEAQWLADVWLPSQCCVMDTVLVGSDVKVVEFNCINCSGFYDSDVDKIFMALWEWQTLGNVKITAELEADLNGMFQLDAVAELEQIRKDKYEVDLENFNFKYGLVNYQ